MMKKIISIVILLTVLSCHRENAGTPKLSIFEPVYINGVRQWILARGNDESKPILLYLHGGPGSSLIPFAHKATDMLVDHCIVVYWDQRGAGLSYNEKIPRSTMNINQFIKDAKTMTDYLKSRFKKKKIFLLGHSWGSTLGTLTVQKYPEDYYAYIGVGQVVNPGRQERLGVQWLKNEILKNGTDEEKRKIRSMEKENWADRKLLKKYGGIVYNIPMNSLPVIMRNSPYSPEKYTGDLYSKGLKFAALIHLEVKNIDFLKTVPELKVPVYFFLGQHDHVTPTEPVAEYFDILKAPIKKIIWFRNSAHRMDIEEPVKFQNEIIKILGKDDATS
jgi:pimeloyl-ACP methyl ester carboxylesterase